MFVHVCARSDDGELGLTFSQFFFLFRSAVNDDGVLQNFKFHSGGKIFIVYEISRQLLLLFNLGVRLNSENFDVDLFHKPHGLSVHCKHDRCTEAYEGYTVYDERVEVRRILEHEHVDLVD